MTNRSESVKFYNTTEQPVLILSSRVGCGNTSIGKAIHELFDKTRTVYHRSIEDFMPGAIVQEDLEHYKFISNNIPLLLALIYTVPFFYQRKLLRETILRRRLPSLKEFIVSNKIRTIICISHRQAFWTTTLKRNESLGTAVYGVLTEFGNNLGWRYIFWKEMDGFIAPPDVPIDKMSIPEQLPVKRLPLPARTRYHTMATQRGSKSHCLLIGGFFGQGRLTQTVEILQNYFTGIHLYVICGKNKRRETKLKNRFGRSETVSIIGVVDSIDEYLLQCRCVITKPGMATMLEARAARRKIFLFKGMPVAETNNACYAISNFDAEWFTVTAFSRWLAAEPD